MTKLSPRRLLLAYLAAMLCFLLLDGCWLTLAGTRVYRAAIGPLMAEQVDWVAVAIFYPLYLVGLLVFAIVPALEQRETLVALRRGALLGLVAYAAYDLTNQATLRHWPWTLTAIDLAWGSFVSGAAAWVAARLTCRPGSRTAAQ